MCPRIAFSGDAQPRSLLCARRNADFHSLSRRNQTVAMARRTFITEPARPVALRARQTELHRAARRHAAAAVALRTNRVRSRLRSRSITCGTRLLPRDVEPD